MPQKAYRLDKIFTRQGHPDFLDLPWSFAMEDWEKSPELNDRIVEVEKGRSRHIVLFVHYTNIYAIKELPRQLAKKEYQNLKKIQDLEIQVVNPVGYVLLESLDLEENKSVLITEYLKGSLPYRSIFLRGDLYRYQHKLLDALAALFVMLHLKGVFWGDCSLSNILFRRDMNELQAYFVDGETSEVHATISSSKRTYDLSIMKENVTGELLDLSKITKLPEELDIYEVGALVENRYQELWEILTEGQRIQEDEQFRINQKIAQINELGFTVDELEISSFGGEIEIRPIVTDRNYHRDKLQNLTGFVTEDNIAANLLSEIYEVKTSLAREKKREIPLSNAAFHWNNKHLYPTLEKIGLEDDLEQGLAIYSELLDIKQDLYKTADQTVSIDDAIGVYRKRILRKREMHLFHRGFRRHRSEVEGSVEPRQLSSDWKEKVIYQIYPISFKDTDANGVGDLPGIVEKLDYLEWLGVDAIRINAIFPSPMVDFGYDVTNFKGIDPIFGDLQDFQHLVDEAHAKKMKVILDIVPNHTSEKHPWFVESRTSIDNPKRDWYIWRDPAPDGGPPNNWISISGESSWTFDHKTGQYYLHSFFSSEPDLNWENPDLRQKMMDVLRFWLDKGVDGILLVMLSWLAKDLGLRDDPKNPNYDPKSEAPYNANIPIYSYDRPHLVNYVMEMTEVIDEYENCILLAELDHLGPLQSFLENYGVAKLVELPLNLRFLDVDWNPISIKEFLDQYYKALPEEKWPTFILSTHDYPRLINRIGKQNARIAAMLLLTLKGVPFIYYGQEIGMQNSPIPSQQIQDPWENIVYGAGRDPQRTPMQWTPGIHAGFTLGYPWLPISEDYESNNVETQSIQNNSLIHLYRELLHIRKNWICLRLGELSNCRVYASSCLSYQRTFKSEKVTIYLNFLDRNFTIEKLPSNSEILLSTYVEDKPEVTPHHIELRPYEGIITRIKQH